MPIFLFPELATALLKLSGRLANWDRLARIEEQLLRRARSAFLVHWFGTGVPQKNLNLLIYIDNIADLSARYDLVERSRNRSNSRLNLFAPLAGTVGVVAGLVFNPTGGTLFATFLRMMDTAFSRDGVGPIIAEILFRILHEHMAFPFWFSVAGLLLLVVAAPFALGAGLVSGIGGDRRVRAVYDLLGDVAMLIDAFLGFWRNITGPLDQIRNPLVRTIIGLLHRITALIFQVVGFAALLIVRLVPLLPSLVAQFRALADLGSAVIDTVEQMVTGLQASLMAPFTARGGIRAILMGAIETITQLPSQLIEIIGGYLTDAVDTVTAAYHHMHDLLTTFLDRMKTSIIAAFMATPVGELYGRITDLLAIVPTIRAEFAAMPGPPPPPPTPPTPPWYRRALSAVGSGLKWVGTEAVDEFYLGGILSAVDDTMDAVGALSLPTMPPVTIPTVPTLPALPDSTALAASIRATTPVDLAATRDALMADARARADGAPVPPELLRTPRSAFAGERRRLAALGPPVISARESQLRDMIYLALGRVLPPALRGAASGVRSMFDQIDHFVYGAPEPPDPAPEIPQLELADSGRLRPSVRLLTIRSPRGVDADLRAFQALVVDAIRQRDYFAAAPG